MNVLTVLGEINLDLRLGRLIKPDNEGGKYTLVLSRNNYLFLQSQMDDKRLLFFLNDFLNNRWGENLFKAKVVYLTTGSLSDRGLHLMIEGMYFYGSYISCPHPEKEIRFWSSECFSLLFKMIERQLELEKEQSKRNSGESFLENLKGMLNDIQNKKYNWQERL